MYNITASIANERNDLYMMTKQIVFTKPYVAELLDTELKPMGEYDVMVKNVVSNISCGTEKANLIGDLNVYGNSTTLPKDLFPRMLGYSAAGIVVDKGAGVKSVEIGDRVATFWGGNHRTINVLKEECVVKLDDNIAFEDAAIFHICTFPLAAVRKTSVEIGESCMVMGLGTLGQLAVTFARLAGAAPVIAADPVAERREMALKAGADYALDPFDPDFVKTVKELTNGGVNAAIEVTGVGAGLDETLDCMAKFGRIALLGCTRNSDFTIDYYRKVHCPGITLIGAHTNARPDKESHPGYFTTRDDIQAVMKLVGLGRLNLADRVIETHTPDECGEVYGRLANDRNFPPFVQFDWRNI